MGTFDPIQTDRGVFHQLVNEVPFPDRWEVRLLGCHLYMKDVSEDLGRCALGSEVIPTLSKLKSVAGP